MREIIKTPAIARVIGCSRQQVSYNMRNGIWKFGRVERRGSKRFCITTISELAKYLGISREEVIRRLEEGET